MAHNINFNRLTGKHSFFSRKEIPWHKLGQVVENALTSEEAIIAAGLDYDVIKCPMYTNIGEDIVRDVPNIFATVRNDTNQVLGTVGNRYEIVQNRQAFDFVDHIVGSKEAVFETAGALGLGEKTFVTAKLPTNIRIASTDDIIDKYILFTNTHDGSGSIVAGFTPIRVVCNNTLNMALQSIQNKIRLRHTTNVHERIKEGRALLGLYQAYSLEFAEALNHLAKQPINDEFATRVLQSVVFNNEEIDAINKEGFDTNKTSTRKKNMFNELIVHVESGVGQELHTGTSLWLYNGVSTYFNNGKDYKSDEDRFTQLTDGVAYKKTQEVFNSLLYTT